MNEAPTSQPVPPSKAAVKKYVRFSPVWLIPILVGLVVIYVGYSQIRKRGNEIAISFSSADGLVPGETPVNYKNVRLGTVEDVHLSDDLSRVEVRLRIERHAETILTDHARFWVVRPRFTGSVTSLAAGLQTLVSGAYIAVDPGQPGGAKKTSFVGLEEPPAVRSDEAGHNYLLDADRLGSLGQGSPVYFRDAVVGEVLRYDVGNGQQPVKLRVFVRAPYDKLVTTNTHFWNVSGLAVNTGPEGLRVEMQSVQAVIAGGIAFGMPAYEQPAGQAPDQTTFKLLADEEASNSSAFTLQLPCVSYFSSSVEGLGPGAPVQMLGNTIGLVREVKLVNDPKHFGGWLARVAFDVQPERIPPPATTITSDMLRAHPPRVFLDSVNIVTGRKVLSLDFDPSRAPKPGDIEMEGNAVVLPGETGGLENVTTALGHVAGKLEQIPFDEIGKNLDATLKTVRDTVGGQDMQDAMKNLSATLADVRQLVKDADQGLAPALQRIPAIADQLQEAVTKANHAFGESGYGADSDFQRNVARLMTQVSEAARSVRLLADFLDRHPEALLRGRSNASEK